MKPLLFLRQTVVKFFEPLTKHTFWTIAASVIIGIALYVGVDIRLAEVVRQNSFPIHILAAEQLIELGPNHAYESGQHANMINQYIEHLERRDYAAILRILYPEYSPKKALASAFSDLEKAANEEEAKKAIWQAGLASNKLYMRSKRFPRSPIRWFESEVVSDRLLMVLDNAFDTFHELVDELEKVQNQEAAVEKCKDSCRESRRVLLLLALARLGYDNKEKKIERYIRDVEKSRDLVMLFEEKYKSEQKLFSDRAKNMNLRAEVAKAMLDNDMNRASKLLRNVIEIAIEKQNVNATE